MGGAADGLDPDGFKKYLQTMEASSPFLIKRRGLMLVLSSPSGAGKTSLSRGLLEKEPQLSLSVSVTTRPQRLGEVEGKDYFFVTLEAFLEQIQENKLLEYAQVFGHFYGTPRRAVEDFLAQGQDVLFDVDWQGTQQLMRLAAADIVRVFILPPSFQELENRLHKRSQDSVPIVQARMAKAQGEIMHWNEYDYVLINDHFDESLFSLQAILRAERLKRERQIGLFPFIQQLLKQGEGELL